MTDMAISNAPSLQIMVRLMFVVDDDNDQRTTLPRTIPARIRHVVDQASYNEFCTKIDNALLPVAVANKNLGIILRSVLYDFHTCVVLVYYMMLLIYSEWTDIMDAIMVRLFLCYIGLLFIPCFLGCGAESPLRSIPKICNEMTSRYAERGLSFHLKTIVSYDSDSGRTEEISHIEVHITTTTLALSRYVAEIKFLPGNSRNEPYHVDRVLPPLLTDHMRMVTYERFCDRLDDLLGQLRTAKRKPGNCFVYFIGFVLLVASSFPRFIRPSIKYSMISIVVFLRCFAYYRIYRYDAQRKAGKKSKNDILNDIRTILHDEMSPATPNASFHLKQTQSIPTTIGSYTWRPLTVESIYVYVSALVL